MNTHHYSDDCHWHAVRCRFQLSHPIDSEAVTSCNCSICEKTGFMHYFLPHDQFYLLTDWKNLNRYAFNTQTAQHYFCSNCGIKSFYQPRSHTDCWSINLRCLDGYSNLKLTLKALDGKNWQQNIHTLT